MKQETVNELLDALERLFAINGMLASQGRVGIAPTMKRLWEAYSKASQERGT